MCFIYCTLLFFPFLRWMWDLPKQNTMNNWTTTLTGDGLNCSHKNGDGMGIVYYRFHCFTTLFQLFINYPTIICSSSTNIHYLLNIHLFIVVLSHWNLHLEWIFPLKSGDFGDDPPCIIPKNSQRSEPSWRNFLQKVRITFTIPTWSEIGRHGVLGKWKKLMWKYRMTWAENPIDAYICDINGNWIVMSRKYWWGVRSLKCIEYSPLSILTSH